MSETGLTKAAVALKAWMVAENMSQAALASKMGDLIAEELGKPDATPLNQSTISSWVRGAYVPNGIAMKVLADLAHIPVADWYICVDSAEENRKPAA